jgi:hypothetical protein
MTEEEARTKWCPYARVIMDWSEKHPVAGPFNRDRLIADSGNEEDHISQALCIGSACMAWRCDRPEDWSAEMWTPTAHGYCGLAGKP